MPLHEGVQVAGAVHHTVDFDSPGADNVEDKVGFHDEHPVAVSPEFGISGDASQVRLPLQSADAFVQPVEKCHGSGGTVTGNPLKDR